MHKIQIPEEIVARSKRIRGERDVLYPTIDPSRTAHVVVDLQNGFMREGAPVEVPIAREIVDNVNAITGALREAGGHVIYLRFTYVEGEPFPWSHWYGEVLSPSESEKMKRDFAPGAHDHALWPTLDVQEGDRIIDKSRYSGLVPGTSTLDEALEELGIDTVIITGTLTNCCCESTARDAMQRDKRVIFVTDGNASITDAEHNATLGNMLALFADLQSTERLLQTISDSRQAVAAE